MRYEDIIQQQVEQRLQNILGIHDPTTSMHPNATDLTQTISPNSLNQWAPNPPQHGNDLHYYPSPLNNQFHHKVMNYVNPFPALDVPSTHPPNIKTESAFTPVPSTQSSTLPQEEPPKLHPTPTIKNEDKEEATTTPHIIESKDVTHNSMMSVQTNSILPPSPKDSGIIHPTPVLPRLKQSAVSTTSSTSAYDVTLTSQSTLLLPKTHIPPQQSNTPTAVDFTTIDLTNPIIDLKQDMQNMGNELKTLTKTLKRSSTQIYNITKLIDEHKELIRQHRVQMNKHKQAYLK